jgi:hypothetical protein
MVYQPAGYLTLSMLFYAFVYCFDWHNMKETCTAISTEGGTQTEGVWEQGAEENILTEEGWGDGRMEKTS